MKEWYITYLFYNLPP